LGFGFDGYAMCDAVQPTRQGVSVPDRPQLLGQKQERGLERILSVLGML